MNLKTRRLSSSLRMHIIEGKNLGIYYGNSDIHLSYVFFTNAFISYIKCNSVLISLSCHHPYIHTKLIKINNAFLLKTYQLLLLDLPKGTTQELKEDSSLSCAILIFNFGDIYHTHTHTYTNVCTNTHTHIILLVTKQ